MPICSNAGFNAEIVGIPKLIINDNKAEYYADAIQQIWTQGTWKKYSMEVSSRIRNNYTEERAKKILLEAYHFATENLHQQLKSVSANVNS